MVTHQVKSVDRPLIPPAHPPLPERLSREKGYFVQWGRAGTCRTLIIMSLVNLKKYNIWTVFTIYTYIYNL